MESKNSDGSHKSGLNKELSSKAASKHENTSPKTISHDMKWIVPGIVTLLLGIGLSIAYFLSSTPIDSVKSVETAANDVSTGNHYADIIGKEGEILIPGMSSEALSQIPKTISAQADIILHRISSQLQVTFSDKRVLEIRGKGRLTLNPEGFLTREASFISSFRKGKRGFEVKVPGALLGIRGTAIKMFVEKTGSGTIDLLEGKVEVKPDSSNTASFIMEAGQSLDLANGDVQVRKTSEERSVVNEKPTLPSVDPENSSTDLPDQSLPYNPDQMSSGSASDQIPIDSNIIPSLPDSQ